MLNPSDAAKYALPQVVRKGTICDKADEAVDIRDILKAMGFWTPEGLFYSYKIDCPWAYEHADGGRDKNCRLFGGTNFYCWASHGYVGPTALYARWKGVSREKAAEVLLEERGLVTKPWRDRWNDLMDERAEKEKTRLGYKEEVIKALHTALKNYPEYAETEFSPEVRARWKMVLGALDKLWEDPATDLTRLTEFFDANLTALVDTARMVYNNNQMEEQ